jgi:polyisoprenyl-phosphate glycosyltransferase
MTSELMPQPASTISIVVPCFNEEAVLRHTYACLSELRERLLAGGSISNRSEIVFVDDGSSDTTWEIIDSWVRQGEPVLGVKLSRNCGHQNALLAGLRASTGEAVITIDADLQDDEGAIESMLAAYQEGNEVVYGVHSRRDADTWFKRTSARCFYRLMAGLGVHTVFDHADYRLLSRRAIGYLEQFSEVNLFLRGIVPLLGLRSAVVRYDRRARCAGESKYPFLKMLEFALNGITSFSVTPLRMIALIGFAVSVACAGLAVWTLVAKLLTNDTVPGWASTILPIYFLGGVQLFCAGVLGEYVGKIYIEVKKRPRFLIERVARPRRAPEFATKPAPRSHGRERESARQRRTVHLDASAAHRPELTP